MFIHSSHNALLLAIPFENCFSLLSAQLLQIQYGKGIYKHIEDVLNSQKLQFPLIIDVFCFNHKLMNNAVDYLQCRK